MDSLDELSYFTISGGDEKKDDNKIYEAKSLEYEKLAPEIRESLKIVEDFIKRKGRIVVGGLSIDILLRNKGHHLYPDELGSFPDLDCISPDNVRDSQELADILYNANMPNVSAIGAMHVQTRRVRIDGRVVADISFVSPFVYDNIPFLMINGMRIIHPLYQRADQHMACSKLYVDPPREVCFNRFKKDIERFNLLDDCYPCIECLNDEIRPKRKISNNINSKNNVNNINSKNNINQSKTNISKYTERFTTIDTYLNIGNLHYIKQTIPKGAIIHGYAAYAAILYGAKKLLKIDKFDEPLIIDTSFKINDDNIEFESPFNEMHYLVDFIPAAESIKDDEFISFFNKYKDKLIEFEPLIDLRPQMFMMKGTPIIEFWNTHGILISAGVIDNFIVPSIQYIMLFLLTGYFHFYRDINLKMYISLLIIIDKLQDIYNDSPEIINSPYFVPTKVFGKTNLSQSQEIKIMRIKSNLGITEIDLQKIPPNYWPETSRIIQNYDYNSCVFFRRSGRPINNVNENN